MKVIETQKVKQTVKNALAKLCVCYPLDVYERLVAAKNNEKNQRALIALKMLEDNAKIAKEKQIPICQDTGMVSVFLHVGFDMCFDGDVNAAIQEAVKEAYCENYLRKSIVSDPLFERINTCDNTPAIIYVDYQKREEAEIEIVAKGFGSENKSALKMLNPADGLAGVKQFVIETVKNAGANACPPMIVGVGIGGSFDYVTLLAKKALLRSLDTQNENENYRKLEEELLEEINKLNIGPLGLKGNTTALKVNIEYFPTHIAGLPVAVNICCHANRHIKEIIK